MGKRISQEKFSEDILGEDKIEYGLTGKGLVPDEKEKQQKVKPVVKVKKSDIKKRKDIAGHKNIYFDHKLWKELQKYAIENNTSVSKVLEELVRDLLKISK